ncbi:MAG: beta-propeller domain-containing protein [Erysipelotrichaceae bacterium]
MKKILSIFISLFILTSCGQTFNYKPTPSMDLTKISSKSQLKTLLTSIYKGGVSPTYNDQKGALELSADGKTSQTNTQVMGIDEGDVVKVNENVLITTSNSKIYIVDIKTNTILSTLDYTVDQTDTVSLYPQELFLLDNQLIIIGSKSTSTQNPNTKDDGVYRFFWWWGYQDTFVQVYDLTNPSQLELSHSFEIKGNYFSARISDGKLLVITNQYDTMLYTQGTEEPDVIEPTVKDVINGLTVSSIDKGNAYVLPGQEGNSFVNIMRYDFNTNAEPDLASYLGWIQTLYMNEEALVLAQARYVYNEKTQLGTTYTDLLKFNIDTLELTAQAEIEGYLLNQFSLDIYKGNLRVALTNWSNTGGVVNIVAVFNSSLKLLDKITDLAPNESIRAVRFINEKGYVVTFENIDPLFVLDLSNPSAIKVVGELKVPGFSTYLHPVSENVLFGIAEDLELVEYKEGDITRISANRLGVKISLFDVSDPSHPREIKSLRILDGNGYTEAAYNHKAIVLDPINNLVYIPFGNYNYSSTCARDGTVTTDCKYTYNYESGIKVLHITETEVELVHTISLQGDETFNSWIYRSAYVDNQLYVLGYNSIRVYDRTTYELIKSIELK